MNPTQVKVIDGGEFDGMAGYVMGIDDGVITVKLDLVEAPQAFEAADLETLC
jgi:hypothetical protein